MRAVLQIDTTLWEPPALLGTIKWIYDYDWEGAQADLVPMLQSSHQGWAHFCRSLGRFDEARVEQAEAERLDPKNVVIRNHASASRFVERRYDDAIQEGRKTVALYPDNPLGYFHVARSSIEKGDYPQALDAIQKLRALDDHPEFLALLGRTYARMGDREKAAEVLRQLEQLSRIRYVQSYFLARVDAGLGDKQRALDYLEKAYEERSEYLVNADWGGLRTDPAWDNLRDEPRFQALLKKVGLDHWPK
jgi:tetratricopeptide (TPR) repeat protein